MTPVGVEPTIAWMKARSPRPLDDGAKFFGKGYFNIYVYLIVAFSLETKGFGILTFGFD